MEPLDEEFDRSLLADVSVATQEALALLEALAGAVFAEDVPAGHRVDFGHGREADQALTAFVVLVLRVDLLAHESRYGRRSARRLQRRGRRRRAAWWGECAQGRCHRILRCIADVELVPAVVVSTRALL